MSALAELQKLVIDTLKADAAVSAIVGANVFDHPPSSDPFPRITMGAFNSVPDDGECISSDEITLQIDCWSRDGGNKHPCSTIVNAAQKALHNANLSLPDPYALISIRVVLVRVVDDPDGLTAHGILTVRAQVEEV